LDLGKEESVLWAIASSQARSGWNGS
jgi:hypothetical protein